MKLTIELVPQSSWYNNVRSNVSTAEWDKIRKRSYELANHKCEVCGGDGKIQGYKHRVECHEIWEYDDQAHTQILMGFVSLCPRCHKVKHPGLAQIKGELEIVISQLKKVNKITRDQAEDYLLGSFNLWRARSQHAWELDISYILNDIQHANNTINMG